MSAVHAIAGGFKSAVAILVVALALAASAQADSGPGLRVDASADRHAISPEIFGTSGCA